MKQADIIDFLKGFDKYAMPNKCYNYTKALKDFRKIIGQ